MRFWPLIFIILFGVTSCKSTKTVNRNKSSIAVNSKTNHTKKDKAHNIIIKATSFTGTKYKFGGTTHKGMDCSGLIFTAFKSQQIHLPRVSRDMATKGRHIKLNEVQKGDLLFFQTSKKRRGINHVGLVVEIKKDNIKFIHSTTSKGVITSSLSESYWNNSFKEARRIL